MRQRDFLCILLAVGCGFPPQDGTIPGEALADHSPVGGAGVGAAGVAPTGAEAALPDPDQNATCEWDSEWFHVWSDTTDYRFGGLHHAGDRDYRVIGHASGPDEGWFGLEFDRDRSDTYFHDATSYRQPPVVVVNDGSVWMAGTRNAKEMSVQRRDVDGVLEWDATVRRAPDDPSYKEKPSASHLVVEPSHVTVVGMMGPNSCCSPTLMAARLSSDGDVEWVRTYDDPYTPDGDEKYEYPIGAYANHLGGVTIGARDHQAGSIDLWVMALDAAGDVQWDRQYAEFERSNTTHFLRHRDRGYLGVGSVDNNHHGAELRLLFIDDQGDVLRDVRVGDPDEQQTAQAVTHARDGRVVVVGHESGGPGPVVWEFSPEGDLNRRIPIHDQFPGGGASLLHEMPDGGWLVAGHHYDGFGRAGKLTRLTPTGQVAWAHEMGTERHTQILEMDVLPDGTITVSGGFSANSFTTGWLMRLLDQCHAVDAPL